MNYYSFIGLNESYKRAKIIYNTYNKNNSFVDNNRKNYEKNKKFDNFYLCKSNVVFENLIGEFNLGCFSQCID